MMRLISMVFKLEENISSLLRKHMALILRISLGITYSWFGFLKFFPGLSPAEGLASSTMDLLTLGLVNPSVSIKILAAWEVLIGLGFITGIFLRLTILLFLLQMIGAMSPLFLLPAETFTRLPYAPTLEGQYIIKNLVLVAAALSVWASLPRIGKA